MNNRRVIVVLMSFESIFFLFRHVLDHPSLISYSSLISTPSWIPSLSQNTRSRRQNQQIWNANVSSPTLAESACEAGRRRELLPWSFARRWQGFSCGLLRYR